MKKPTKYWFITVGDKYYTKNGDLSSERTSALRLYNDYAAKFNFDALSRRFASIGLNVTMHFVDNTPKMPEPDPNHIKVRGKEVEVSVKKTRKA